MKKSDLRGMFHRGHSGEREIDKLEVVKRKVERNSERQTKAKRLKGVKTVELDRRTGYI